MLYQLNNISEQAEMLCSRSFLFRAFGLTVPLIIIIGGLFLAN